MNSFLVLAWVYIATADLQSLAARALASAVPSAINYLGLAMSALWFLLAFRSNMAMNVALRVATGIEKLDKSGFPKPYTELRRIRSPLKYQTEWLWAWGFTVFNLIGSSRASSFIIPGIMAWVHAFLWWKLPN